MVQSKSHGNDLLLISHRHHGTVLFILTVYVESLMTVYVSKQHPTIKYLIYLKNDRGLVKRRDLFTNTPVTVYHFPVPY